jgi:two-component system, chemotaxis family, protein-glutamate methylesterase/glutaminase
MINEQRVVRDFVAIGASAGGVMALIRLLELLPGDLPAALAIVLHRSPFHETQLPFVLGRRSPLKVIEPHDGIAVQSGVVYVAPRDQHMVVYDGVVRLDRGPKQHRTRPAIDPLFRSAAAAYGRRVVGVLLSGMGGDGVSGLIDIKHSGGVSLVQSPAEAEFPTMPSRAIKEDDVDRALTVAGIAEAITLLAAGQVVESGAPRTVVPER